STNRTCNKGKCWRRARRTNTNERGGEAMTSVGGGFLKLRFQFSNPTPPFPAALLPLVATTLHGTRLVVGKLGLVLRVQILPLPAISAPLKELRQLLHGSAIITSFPIGSHRSLQQNVQKNCRL